MCGSRHYLRVARAALLPCLILAGMAVAAYAIGSSQEIAPPKVFTTTNEFLTRGHLLNGEVVATSPLRAVSGLSGPTETRSGWDPEGFIARARLTDPSFALGDFKILQPMSAQRQGAGAVVAMGPAREDMTGLLPPPNDVTTWLYIVGGMDQGYALNSIERAFIDADGNIHPGLEANPAGFLAKARYGAAVVARDNFIYVVGGYDQEHQPLDGIERFEIGPGGVLGTAVPIAGPGHGGDVAAVIANGWMYVIGGNSLVRGPDEKATSAVSRAPIDPRGDLGAFESMSVKGAELPLATAGGRAFVIAGMAPTPVYYIYYVGGNVGNLQAGATTNVYRLKLDPATNDYSIPWESVQFDGQLVRLNDPRELFAAVVTNGFAYVIGGETTALGQTTYYSTVERAPVGADGSIGPFRRLEEPAATYINGLDRASDIAGVAFNNRIFVPGGRDDLGNAMKQVFQLDLDQAGALLDGTVPDVAVLDPIHDLTRDMEIDSLTLGIEPDAAFPYGTQFRFRWAADKGSWSDWSGYFAIGKLPSDPGAMQTAAVKPAFHVLDLSYPKGAATACSAEMVPNPTAIQGPITARYFEYEVVMPAGGQDQKFQEMTINAHPMAHFALPGGYDPRYAGSIHPPSCSPGNAIADTGTEGWVRLTGAGFTPTLSVGQFRFVSADASAPPIEIVAMESPDSSTLDLKVKIGAAAGGPYDYSLLYRPDYPTLATPNEQTLMATAIKVHPAILMANAPLPGLDVNISTPSMMENVVEAPDAVTGKVAFTVAVSGLNIRSGRVNDTGPVAADDPTSSSHWPENPLAGSDQPPILRYKLSDAGGGMSGHDPLKIENTNAGEWVEVPASQTTTPQRFDIRLEVPHTAMSGAHALEITVQNPQMGSVATVKQTVYVVPAFTVNSVVTRLDPNPDPDPNAANNYDWSGAHDPAMADLGDGFTGPELKIGLNGYGFRSDQGNVPLVGNAAYDTDPMEIGPFATGLAVADPKTLDIRTSIPMNGTTGRHGIALSWSYDPAADGYNAAEHVPPNPATAVIRNWTGGAGDTQWLSLYVAPTRTHIHTILGAANTQDPTVLLASDPTLTVNGDGFGVGGPAQHGFDTTLCTARLMSLSNSPAEDIQVPKTGMHTISDGQARLTMTVPDTQRAGEMYQLEVCTSLGLPATSKVREPYASSLSTQQVTVLPLPQCAAVSGTSCFAAKQGETLDSVTVTGQNFDSGTKVHLGPDVTATVLSVCHDDAACPSEDVLTFKVQVSPQAAPGARTLEIENGPTSSLSQKASCSQQYDFWVVPVPAISKMQPSLIQQAPVSVGSKVVPIDIYGANFVPGATVTPSPADGVTVKGQVVVVDSGHITTELLITGAAAPGDITLEVGVPSGPACMTTTQKASTKFAITAFPELSITAVSNSAPSQCQGRSGMLTVTGANFKDPATGATLVASASLGADVTIDALSITGPTALTVSYTISDSASPGKRALTLDPIAQGATPAVYPDTLTITTSPVIFSVSPQTLQGGTTKEFTLSGRNFFEGGADVAVEPANDITVQGLTVKSTGQIVVALKAEATAGSLQRSIVVTNSDGGQCNVARINSALRVIPEIAISSVSTTTPSQCQGRSGALTVTGVNFRDSMSGAALVASASLGADVSIDSLTIASATSLTVNFTINDNAAVGSRPLALLPVLQGAGTATHAGAVTITSSPSIVSVSPQTVQRGSTALFTISGRNFLPGADVAFQPATGLTVSNVSVVNGGQITATLQVDPNAAINSRTIVVHNGGGGSCSDASFQAAVKIFDPPHITKIKFSDGTLSIAGTNFHRTMQAFVAGSTTPWARAAVNKKGTLFVIKKAKSAFPKGVEVSVRLLNPDDGGEVTFTFKR